MLFQPVRRFGVSAVPAAAKSPTFWRGAFMAMALFFCPSNGIPWQSPCDPGRRRAVDRLLELDKLIEADSAFSALESECFLTPNDLLKWMRVKAVISQYSEAARIGCMVVREQPEVAFLVQEQLTEMLREAGPDTIRGTMRSYGDCLLALPNQDTTSVRQFLAAIYGRFKLPDEETAILLRLDTKRHPAADDIFAAALRRFAEKSYSDAIRLSLKAYERMPDGTRRSSCAMMLHQSYARTGKNDSAALWLQKVPLSRPDVKAQAIVFFQRMGLAEKADSLGATLPQSFLRDTLTLRRMFYSADFEAASALCAKLSAKHPSQREKNDLLLWRVRARIFCGKADLAGELLDSVEFTPGMNGAQEFLTWKYELATLGNYPGTRTLFGLVAYASWLMRPDKALEALSSSELDSAPADVKKPIVLRGIRTLMKGGLFTDARKLMERPGIASMDNEFRYYYGEVLYNEGAIGSSRKVFEEMLLAHPGDVFSERARIFLLRMNGNEKGGHYGDTLDEKRHH